MTKSVPRADYAIIGGSSTNSIDFPRVLKTEDPALDLEILGEELVFPTPWGDSPSFVYFRLGEKHALTCPMHGWRAGVKRADASRQIFWVFREAGVQKVLSEGGVGAINHLLKPRDLVAPSDYQDHSMRKDVSLDSPYLLIMRQAVCPQIHKAFVAAAEANAQGGRVFERGVYVNTDGRHFESPAEVAMFRQMGGDVVGQSMCPEVYLAREIGACYGRIDLVVNYAEGVVKDWEHEELKEIFYHDALAAGRRLIETLQAVSLDRSCGCHELRKPTLLKGQS